MTEPALLEVVKQLLTEDRRQEALETALVRETKGVADPPCTWPGLMSWKSWG